MDLIEILQKTITGTPEELEETYYFLKEQQGNPEYISCLLEILSNCDIEENIRLQAAIQLKIQVQNDPDLQIDFSTICTLIGISPILIQLQLQIILYSFIKKRVDSDEIEQIASICAEFIETDANYALVSVMILRFLVKLLPLKAKSRPSEINYEFIISYVPFDQFFEPIANLILSFLESEDISQYLLFIHSSLHMIAKFLDKIAPQNFPAIENLVEIITQIINRPAFQSTPFLDKDSIKLACSMFGYLSPEINANLLLSIATHSIKQASFQTTAISFRFLNLGLQSEEIWPAIEPQQFNLVGGLYFRTFILTEQDFLDIRDDLYSFISKTQVSSLDFRTPRNGAETSFKTAVKYHETFAECAIKIVICELESFRESSFEIKDIARAYGALQFAGIALQKDSSKNSPDPFVQKYTQMIYETATSMLEINNFVYTAGFFLFVSLIWEVFSDVEVLFKCFDALVNYPESGDICNPEGYVEDPERDLVQYFASAAAAKLLANFKKDNNLWAEIQQEVNSNGSLKPLLLNVLRICKLYPTDQSVGTLRSFTGFFIENIAPVATEYMSELFSIFSEYASEPEHCARLSITSCQILIADVSSVIRDQIEDVPPSFFSEALDKIEEVALQCDPKILEEVLELMACFTECMTEISEPFVKVPQVLLNVIERDEEEWSMIESSEIDLTDPISPSKSKGQVMPDKLSPTSLIDVIKALVKINPEVVTSMPEMFLPIVELSKYFLAKFNSSESPDFVDTVPFFQIIFIKLKGYPSVDEFAPTFLEMLDSVDSSPAFEFNLNSIIDIVAALVYFDPVLTLNCERNFEAWMSSRPAAFLLGALSVIKCWDSLSENITQIKDQIVKKINENLQIISDQLQTDDSSEDKDIFNFNEILESFSQISLE